MEDTRLRQNSPQDFEARAQGITQQTGDSSSLSPGEILELANEVLNKRAELLADPKEDPSNYS